MVNKIIGLNHKEVLSKKSAGLINSKQKSITKSYIFRLPAATSKYFVINPTPSPQIKLSDKFLMLLTFIF